MKPLLIWLRTLGPLTLALLCFTLAVQTSPAAPPPTMAGPVVLQSNAQGIVVLVTAEMPTFTPVVVNGHQFQKISIPGYETLGEAGAPGLPSTILSLGVPAGRSLSVQVTPLEVETLTLAARPAPMEAHQPMYREGESADDPLAQPTGLVSVPAFDPVAYTQAAQKQGGWFPAEPATIGAPGLFRDQPFAQVVYQPLQVNLSTGEARVIRRAQLEVRFGPAEDTSTALASGNPAPDPLFDSLRSSFVLNAETAEGWRLNGPTAQSLTQGANALGVAPFATPRWRVRVEQPGIYQLTRSQLTAAGVPEDTLRPAAFRLERAASPPVVVPVSLDVGTDGLLDSAYFYVESTGSEWDESTIYWISAGEPSPAMTTQSAAPTGATPATRGTHVVHTNPQSLYASTYTNLNDGEVWFGGTVLSGVRNSRGTEFTAHTPTSAAQDAQMHIRLMGGRAGYHGVQLSINGSDVGPLQVWRDKRSYNATISFPGSLLRDGINTMTMTIPATDTNTYALLDWFTITYTQELVAVDNTLDVTLIEEGVQDVQVQQLSGPPLVMDVSNPATPIHLTNVALNGSTLAFHAASGAGSRYAITTSPRSAAVTPRDNVDLRNPANGADYIIVTHPDFVDALGALRDHHTNQNLRVFMATTQQIYDEFGDGTVHPQWIKDFLHYAYNQWTAPRPAFVLLVGDATFDPLGHLNFESQVYVPTFLDHYDAWLGETSSDNRFVTLSGDDIIPDMHIGRLPVNSAAEATAVVNKILDYAANQTPVGMPVTTEHWARHLLLVTDNYPDPAGNFYEFSDSAAEDYYPMDALVRKVYVGIDTCPNNSCADEVQQRVVDEFNAENLLVQYIGHAEKKQWGFDPTIFQTANLDSLTNEHLPMMLPWTCWSGYFINPDPAFVSLDEQLLRLPNAGSIASFAPSGLDVATGHDSLTRGFYDGLFRRQHTRIGDLVMDAKLNLCNTIGTCTGISHVGSISRLVDTYLLIGDPAVYLDVPGCMIYQGDVTCDCTVQADDMQHISDDWRKTQDLNPRYDLNGDQQVNIVDLQLASQQWGLTCPKNP